MFKICSKNSYTWPVALEIPVDGGQYEKAPFDAEFKRLSQTRIDQIFEEAKEGALPDIQIAREILVGWNGVVDEAGAALPYSEENKERLLEVAFVRAAVVVSFLKSLQGGAARLGN